MVFLAVWALASCLPPSRLFCVLLRMEPTPRPTMSEGAICLPGLGRWPGVCSAACLSPSPYHGAFSAPGPVRDSAGDVRGAQGRAPDQRGVVEGYPETRSPELRVEMRVSCLRGGRERGEVKPWAFLEKERSFECGWSTLLAGVRGVHEQVFKGASET